MGTNASAYERWRAVNERARARENELSRAWADFFDRRTPKPPADDLIADVQSLRRQADELLSQVIAEGKPGAPRGP